MQNMNVSGKSMVQVMLNFAGQSTKFWYEAAENPSSCISQSVGLTLPISCNIDLKVTFAEEELIKFESINDSRFRTRDRKSGDNFAESL